MIEMNRTRLRAVLRIDAASGALMGAPVAAFAGPLAPLLGLPEALLFWGGLALFPVAATMLAAAATLARPLVLLVTWGNVAWAVGCVALVLALPVTALGAAFLLAQIVFVLAMAYLEGRGMGAEREAAV